MHDELLLEVRCEALSSVAAMTKRVMEGVMEDQVQARDEGGGGKKGGWEPHQMIA